MSTAATAFADPFDALVGSSRPLCDAIEVLRLVAPRHCTILITGRTGTGKELAAQAIHGASARRERALVSVNCGAIAKDLVESEFFGHVKGDDLSEPIADAARSLLDGHIVLSRELAAANHFPAIDVLESVSRLTDAIATQQQSDWMAKLRDAMAAYRRSEDLINLGAYTAGSNAKLDAAVKEHDHIQGFLQQKLRNAAALDDTMTQLETLAGRI